MAPLPGYTAPADQPRLGGDLPSGRVVFVAAGPPAQPIWIERQVGVLIDASIRESEFEMVERPDSAGPIAVPAADGTPAALFLRRSIDRFYVKLPDRSWGERVIGLQLGPKPIPDITPSREWVVAGAVSVGHDYLISFSDLKSDLRVIARVAPSGKLIDCSDVHLPMAIVSRADQANVVIAGGWDGRPVLLIYEYRRSQRVPGQSGKPNKCSAQAVGT
jgi:hypothetical protein